jgi:hypothetical protein
VSILILLSHFSLMHTIFCCVQAPHIYFMPNTVITHFYFSSHYGMMQSSFMSHSGITYFVNFFSNSLLRHASKCNVRCYKNLKWFHWKRFTIVSNFTTPLAFMPCRIEIWHHSSDWNVVWHRNMKSRNISKVIDSKHRTFDFDTIFRPSHVWLWR